MDCFRQIAFEILNSAHSKNTEVSELLDEYLPNRSVLPQTVDVVNGVLRNQSALNRLIELVSGAKLKNIRPVLLPLLQIGFYEFIYTHAAEHAVVDELVQIAKSGFGTKSAGFINAVLRNLQRNIEQKNVRFDDKISSYLLPVSMQNFCRFKMSVLPDRNERPAEYLADAFSLPQWLISGWLEQFDFASVFGICLGSNRRPSVYLRPNPLKTDIQTLSDLLAQSDIRHQAIEEYQMISLQKPGNIVLLPGFKEGLFCVQDPAATLPVKALSPQPDQTILDLCAAPGTKTMQIAELMNNKGVVIATDINPQRRGLIERNRQRLGADIVQIVDYEQLVNDIRSGRRIFDAVLLDVPCSNTGVLARRCEVRHRITSNAIARLASAGAEMLGLACAAVKSGGKLCYSTCSLEQQENEIQIEGFLKNYGKFRLVADKLTLPCAGDVDHDGGYYAVLQKL